MKLGFRPFVRRRTRPRSLRIPPSQAAAVCYRRSQFSIEFLLVNTSSGKWTFPKGRIAPGLSGPETAAREALEEAGVRGRIANACLAHYVDLKRALGHDNASREIVIAAHLLEVRSLCRPEESGRNPTWFSPRETKYWLADRRALKYSRELTRIVDLALQQIKGSHKTRPASSRRAQSRLTARRS